MIMNGSIINCCTVSLVLCIVILAMLAMFFNYSLKLKDKSIELEKRESHSQQRIKDLEQRNGSEQKQIDQLKQQLADMKMSQLKKSKDHDN